MFQPRHHSPPLLGLLIAACLLPKHDARAGDGRPGLGSGPSSSTDAAVTGTLEDVALGRFTGGALPPGLSHAEVQAWARDLSAADKESLVEGDLEQSPTWPAVTAWDELADETELLQSEQLAFGTAADLCWPSDSSWTLSMSGNDDQSSGLIPLGFDFPFYGTTETSTYINNNGNLSFGTPFSTFTPSGFPVLGFPMVAPFWGDVDTRAGLGTVRHKFFGGNTLVVTWDAVGYYSTHGDLLNTFQVAISDGTNPDLGLGNTVCFCYGEMEWTTGDASGGSGGFGGAPATVGGNKGDGANFFQVGQFDHPGTDYDGPGGNPDGVSYLDDQRYCFTTGAENIPPVAQDFPPGDLFTVVCDSTLMETVLFTSPELAQTTTVVIDDPDGAQAQGLVITNTPGNPATIDLLWATDAPDVGTYILTLTATDDGTPLGETVRTLTLIVEECPNQPPVASCADAALVVDEDCTATLGLASVDDGSFDPDGAADIDSVCITAVDGSPVGCVDSVVFTDELGPHVVTVTITDLAGESDSCDAIVTVSDLIAPQLLGVPPNDTASCAAVPPPADVLAEDNCDGPLTPVFVEVRVDGTCPDEYTLLRSWSAEDRSGNATSAMQEIVVSDSSAPRVDSVLEPVEALPPSPPSSVCSAPTSRVFRVQGSASDDCDPSPLVSAQLLITHHDVPAPDTCIERVELVDVEIGELIELRLLPPLCPDRPRSPRSSFGINSANQRVFSGESIELLVTATDRCGNVGESGFDPAEEPSALEEERLPDGSPCPAIARPPAPARCADSACGGPG